MDDVSSQASNLSKPSAKSIYRKLTLMNLTSQILNHLTFLFCLSILFNFIATNAFYGI